MTRTGSRSSGSATRSSPTTRRAVTFLVADGVLPSNEGRGYVLRRIMRRAIRHGRLLGRTEPFLGETAKVVIDTMAEAYPHLSERRDEILGVIEREERQFSRTLEAGVGHPRGGAHPAHGGGARRRPPGGAAPRPRPVLPGEVAFRLHDTYGFPIDLTVELAAEYGVRVDLAGFQDALAAQRDRSRANTKTGLAEANLAASRYAEILGRTAPTGFLGYETTTAEGRVVAILRDGVGVRDARGGPRGGAPRRGCRARRDRARPNPVLRGVRRPGRRHGRAPGGRRDRSCSTSNDVQRVAGTQTAGLTVHRGRAPRPAGGRRHADRRGRRRSDAPTRCATTRPRTCSTGRCATRSATGRARRAAS